MYFFSHIKHNLLKTSRPEGAHCLILCHIAAASMASILGGPVLVGRRVQRAFSPALPPLLCRMLFIVWFIFLSKERRKKGNDKR